MSRVMSSPSRASDAATRMSGAPERLRTALHEAVEAFVELMTYPPQRDSETAIECRDQALLIDVQTAAELLGISVTALRRFERRGVLPAVRMGRRLLFRREVLTRFVADHERLRE